MVQKKNFSTLTYHIPKLSTMKQLVLITLLLNCFFSYAQIGTGNEELYPSVKSKTLYVIVSDTTSANAKKMNNAIRSAWTVSTIAFVSPKQITSYYKPGNFFVTLERSTKSFRFVREGLNNRMETSKDITNDYFFLNFWLNPVSAKKPALPM